MEIKRVCILYFSATGNTEKTVGIIGETLAEAWGVPLERFSFTRPAELCDGGRADLCGKAAE